MRRLFPVLASVVGLLLMAGFASGLLGRSDDLGRVVRLASASAALAVHASAFVYLQATGRRVEAIAGRSGLPGWVGAQAEKNLRKALIYEIPGLAIAVVGAGLVVGEWWQPIVWGSSVSFQIGAFLGEWMIVANQSRLVEHVMPRAASDGPAREP